MLRRTFLLAAVATCLNACASSEGGLTICGRNLAADEIKVIEHFIEEAKYSREDVASILTVALSQPDLYSACIIGIYDLNCTSSFKSKDQFNEEKEKEKAWEKVKGSTYDIIVRTGHVRPTGMAGDIFYLTKTAGAWEIADRSAWMTDEPNTSSELPIFFPESVFSPRKDRNDRAVRRYSWHLVALNEPSIFEKKADVKATTYRFLYLRSFDHPIAIRIEVGDGGKTGMLFYKEGDGSPGEPKALIKSKSLSLNEGDISELDAIISRMRILEMKTRLDKEGVAQFDGARWIVEVLDRGMYHIVDRWSEEKTDVYDLCMLMVRLSGENIGKVY